MRFVFLIDSELLGKFRAGLSLRVNKWELSHHAEKEDNFCHAGYIATHHNILDAVSLQVMIGFPSCDLFR